MFGSGKYCWQQNFLGETSPMGLLGRIPSRGQKIEMAFQPVPMGDIMPSDQVVHDEPGKVPPVQTEASPRASCHIWTPS